MSSDYQLKICRQCLHQKMDYPNGIVCEFTNEPGDFSVSCPKHVKYVDPFYAWLHHNADNSQSLYDEYIQAEGRPKIVVEEEEGGSTFFKIIGVIISVVSMLISLSECK